MEEFKINTDSLRESFSKKWKNFKCNCCEQNDWNIADEIYELRAFRWWNIIIWKIPIIPIIPVTCNNCWNTIFINAIVLKLIDNSKKNDEK